MVLLSDILDGLHFHVVLSLKLQSENAGTYVHFVFIYSSSCKIVIYWPIFKM